MKTKLIGLALTSVLSCGAVNAVTLTTTLISNTSNNVGLVTTLIDGLTVNLTGSAFIYSTSADLTPANVAAVTSRAGFEALVLNDPGVVRSNIAFTNGAVTSSASTELGAVGNKTYVWFNSADAKFFGLFQGANVPALGAVTLNSNTMTEDLIGTSTYTATGTSGFQLVSIPEPSALFFGAIGALCMARRRRI